MKFFKFRPGSSIYSRIVVLILTISLVFFAVLAYVIFSFNRTHMEEIIQQFSTRVSLIINRSLHESMLMNDNTELKQLIRDMSRLPGLVRINIYDQRGILKHTTRENGRDSVGTLVELPEDAAARSDQIQVTREERFRIFAEKDRGRVLSVTTPILSEYSCAYSGCHVHRPDEEILGQLEVQMSLAEIDHKMITTEVNYLILVTLFILSAITILILFTRHTIHKPLSHIVRASNEVARGNLDIRIPVEEFRDSDINNVAGAFNNMLDQIHQAHQKLRRWSRELEESVRVKTEELKRTQTELIRIERMASLGKLSSSVAHEINNPLAGVLTYSKLIGRHLKDRQISQEKLDDILGYLDMIESETIRCGNIVKGLLDFSRQDHPKFEVASLNKLMKETRVLMEHSFKVAEIELESRFEAVRDRVNCNPNQIKQVCIAVLVNALEAMESGGKVTFMSSNNKALTEINIEIIDQGIGISQEDMDHIFEPFFSRKKEGSGTGLGLAVTYGIVQQHQGRIEVKSEIRKGTHVTISLPLYTDHEEPTHA